MQEELKEAFRLYDKEGKQMVIRSFWIFRENYTKIARKPPKKFVRFSRRTGNGYIKTSDLKDILRALDDKLTNNELDEMIAEVNRICRMLHLQVSTQ